MFCEETIFSGFRQGPTNNIFQPFLTLCSIIIILVFSLRLNVINLESVISTGFSYS